jgi:hypothetical protein
MASGDVVYDVVSTRRIDSGGRPMASVRGNAQGWVEGAICFMDSAR